MAETAFDKHVEFAETYVAKTNDALDVLFREGSTKLALGIAAELYAIRRKYVLWETKDVTIFLDKFERALREIGADEHLLEHVPVGENRTKLVEKVYATFAKIVGLVSLPNEPTSEIAISNIIDQLREHLGINQLTSLRKHYLAEAIKRMM